MTVHFNFKANCRKGHLEISKWIYQLSVKNNNPINIHADDEHLVVYRLFRNQ